ncbi:MAG: sulfurtransferase TusA family protein [Cyanobacteria bacterium RI_101]|jgi:TusA-related sulfurtransferase|nr:sulfurtransferase TusA family protein [Cyanobacteria bacterium RI_101]MEB3173754.1 sulfurtransferase TusA family protein [Cyanobacteriota bacterium]
MSALEPVYLDLRGTPCPINFVRAKLKLSQLQSGQTLAVDLDGGEPTEQVPHSLTLEGFTAQTLEPLADGSGYRLTIQVP